MRSIRIFLSMATILACACGDSSSSPAEPVAAWSLQPELRVSGADSTHFSWIAGIAVAPDGAMFTLHPSEPAVRVWSSEGEPRGRFGDGAGPGALRDPVAIGMLTDTVWVADPLRGRFALYGLDGSFAGSVTPPAPPTDSLGGAPRATGFLPSGDLVATESYPAHVEAAGRVKWWAVVRMGRNGGIVDTLTMLPVGHTVLPIGPPDSAVVYTLQPLPDAPLFAVSDADSSWVVVDRTPVRQAKGAAYDVAKVHVSGDTVFHVSVPYDPVPVPTARIDSFVAFWAAQAGRTAGVTADTAAAWVRRALAAPAFRPPVTALGTGLDGSVWLVRESESGEPPLLDVLGADGSFLARFRSPPGLRLLAADTARVWGTFTDSADVPWLVRYRIRKS